ncbi:unnamed protein product [Cyprideis torosa]|uniref:Signal peptidase complex catalytic subunit SEC11 n=1 Tax=Cyprideis torosa TaxID=163714 RepID=A0A7R8WIM6_9CRUS|nr:unnamed protein product [Cyprideis torosa]CAG0894279.1 unnamed protein product [Cyprideis torosa]
MSVQSMTEKILTVARENVVKKKSRLEEEENVDPEDLPFDEVPGESLAAYPAPVGIARVLLSASSLPRVGAGRCEAVGCRVDVCQLEPFASDYIFKMLDSLINLDELRRMNKRQLFYQVLNFAMIVSSALMIWKGLMVVTGSESPIVVVLSGSMEPAFHRGDLLFLTNYREDPIRVGEIVVFKVEGRDIPIVHRVLKLHEKENGTVKFLTKGDNNNVDDRGLYAPGQLWLTQKDVVGRARGFVPAVGIVTIIMNDYPKFKTFSIMMDRRFFLLVVMVLLLHASANAQRKAVAILRNSDTIKGTITFTEMPDSKIHVTGNITGLPQGKHGFHVHMRGDITNCATALGHFNPFGKNHGAPSDEERHVGDLGNIEANGAEEAFIDIVDSVIKFDGAASIIGRSVMIHANEDDLGKGNEPDSSRTGHAGPRIACGVIGIASAGDFSGNGCRGGKTAGWWTVTVLLFAPVGLRVLVAVV